MLPTYNEGGTLVDEAEDKYILLADKVFYSHICCDNTYENNRVNPRLTSMN